jgi:hypothetical protein
MKKYGGADQEFHLINGSPSKSKKMTPSAVAVIPLGLSLLLAVTA